LEKIFKEALGDDKIKIQVEALKSDSVPGIILLSEQSRRMQEMSRLFGGGQDMAGMFPDEETLVLNTNNSLIKSILNLDGREDKKEEVELICRHIYDIVLMSHRQLEPEAMTRFIERNNLLLNRLVESEN
jgi:molecular chaperone HtpG